MMSLATLGLKPALLRALKEKGYTLPTKIQQELIPAIFSGTDIIAGAQTGTGKTAGFALPILQELLVEFVDDQHYAKALIIVPTRELALQMEEAFASYGKYLPLKTLAVVGGANMMVQARRLKSGVDIVIATSGRLLEHIQQKNIDLNGIDYLVLDEADMILDMGFMPEVSKIFHHLPNKRQNILISATLSGSVKQLANQILNHPKLIEIDSMGTPASTVEEIVYPVVEEKKLELLSYLIGARNYKQVLVFARKKEVADEVGKELTLSGLPSAVIHGERGTGERKRALEGFKEGKIRVLVATDIAARGLDIPELAVVINFDIPHVIGDYIHRIGRTGRAGAKGLAITLNSPSEKEALKDVEKLMGKVLPQKRIDGYAPIETETQRTNDDSSTPPVPKRTQGAFGKKQQAKSAGASNGKKRKTTKRDGFKAHENAQGRGKSTRKKRAKKGKR